GQDGALARQSGRWRVLRWVALLETSLVRAPARARRRHLASLRAAWSETKPARLRTHQTVRRLQPLHGARPTPLQWQPPRRLSSIRRLHLHPRRWSSNNLGRGSDSSGSRASGIGTTASICGDVPTGYMSALGSSIRLPDGWRSAAAGV